MSASTLSGPCGGAMKQGVLEIQGDRRVFVKTELEAAGYKVRLIG